MAVPNYSYSSNFPIYLFHSPKHHHRRIKLKSGCAEVTCRCRCNVYLFFVFLVFPHFGFPFLDCDVPRRPFYGVYIFQLIRFARVCGHVEDSNARNK